MIEDYGFLRPRAAIASSPDQAADLASRMGFPVVLKIVSPDILHKTDVGGVALGCSSDQAVRSAYADIVQSVQQKTPRARIDGVSVEEQIASGVEVVIGLNNDPQFGPVIMFGLGGIFLELLHDVSFRVLPITEDDARSMIQEIKGRPILDGYRGQPPVSTDMLVGLLMQAGRMGMDLADRLDSVDLNPVAVWGDQHRVLDAKVLLRPAAAPIQTVPANVAHLASFFTAKSVALVGASDTPGKIGNAVLDSLAKHDYAGKVFPINPARAATMGLTTYPSLASIPDPVDLVVVTVSLSAVPAIIRESASKGVHGMVIISGGGKELGGDSRELESTIRQLARENDVRIVGCNCIGVFDAGTRLDTFFQVHERMVRPKLGPIAMISQSGTVGAAFLEAVEAVGISKFVSYGNRIDVDEADLLAFLADDPDTRVIACYIEGLEDGRKFLASARLATQKKPVVVFKSGRSPQAARASLSHTGFFGGTYGVSLGAFRQAGVIAVESIEELSAAAKALAMQPRARGRRVAMISNGAGSMVQAMDLFEPFGLSVPPLAQETVDLLRKVYPPYYLVQNPVDVTGSATSADYEAGIRALVDDPNVDIVMPWFVFQDTPLDEGILDALDRLNRVSPKPIVVGAMGGPYTLKMVRAVEELGVPAYLTVREWVTAARSLTP
jgi:3-hydroxypropionyl-CoA synthetase (ADP-forming)